MPVIAAVLLAALAGGEAACAAGWAPRVAVRTVDEIPQSLGSARVAVNAGGHAVVAWSEVVAGTVEAAVRAPGGSFTLAVPALSPPGASDPRVGIDAAGNATVAWTRGDVVQVADRPAGGAFGGAQDILEAGTAPSGLELAVDALGRAVAVWRGGPSTPKASVRPAGGPFGTPTSMFVLAPAPPSWEHAIGSNAAGDVVAAIWNTVLSGWAWADGGATFLGPVGLGVYLGSQPRVAVGPGGAAAVAWKQNVEARGIRVQLRPGGGTFEGGSHGLLLAGTGAGSEYPATAVDADGNTIVLWSEGGILRSAFRPAGGAFSAPQDVPGTTGVTVSQVAFLPDGTAVAAFFEADRIVAAVRPPGGAFGPAVPLSADDALIASDVALAVDDEGNLLAVWSESFSDTEVVAASYYDPAPPVLDALAVPAAGRVGQAVAVSVAASDRVGPVSVGWTFGDGGAAAGPDGAHVYAAPGAYTVTATATDAVGNATTATAPITVVLCVDVADCGTVLAAALPDPATAATRAARRAAKRLARFARKAGDLLARAADTSGRKQARALRRAGRLLDRLVATARKADAAGRLGVPLPALEAAVEALRAVAPAPH